MLPGVVAYSTKRHPEGGVVTFRVASPGPSSLAEVWVKVTLKRCAGGASVWRPPLSRFSQRKR